MKIPLLKPATEELLNKALSEFIDDIVVSSNPKRSLEKIARQYRFSPDQIRRLANAYHTGVILNQVKTSKDIFEKVAVPHHFDINVEEVIHNIFGNVKLAAEESVSPDYLHPPKVQVNTCYKSGLEKLALKEKALRALTGAENYGKSSYNFVPKQKQKSELFHKQAAIRYSILNNLFSLRDYFRQENAIDPSEVIENSAVVYGPKISLIVKEAMKGVSNTRFRKYAEVDWNKTPYKEIADIYRDSQQLRKYSTLINRQQIKEKPIKSVYTGSVVNYLANNSCIIANQLSKDAESEQKHEQTPTQKQAINLDQLIDLALASRKSQSATSKETELAANVNEQHKLNHYRVRALIADLANNHPIISKYSLEQIIQQYNTLSAMAPIAMQYEPVVTQYLAKALENDGRLDPIDLEALSKINYNSSQIAQDAIEFTLEPRPAKSITQVVTNRPSRQR